MERILTQGQYFGDGLKSYDNDFLKLSITHYEPFYAAEKHYHENDYISILAKGDYVETNRDDNELITAGKILYRPKDYVHKNHFQSEGGTCFNIEFKTDWQQQLGIGARFPKKFMSMKAGQHPSLYKMFFHFKSDQDFDIENLAGFFSELDNRFDGKPELHCVRAVIRIIEKELDVFHSLASLAEKVLVHPIYLARAFRQKTGMTIGQFQLKAKLENALPLLLQSKLTISDISFNHGFYDDAHFIKAFKSVYGISPYQFKLKAKG